MDFAAALVGMNIRAADRRHRDSDRTSPRLAGHRESLQEKGVFAGFVNGRLAVRSMTWLSAKSTISLIVQPRLFTSAITRMSGRDSRNGTSVHEARRGNEPVSGQLT